MNARGELLPLRVTCAELGRYQPATPMRTDNNTVSGIINGTLKQARSKAIDMRFYWLLDSIIPLNNNLKYTGSKESKT